MSKSSSSGSARCRGSDRGIWRRPPSRRTALRGSLRLLRMSGGGSSDGRFARRAWVRGRIVGTWRRGGMTASESEAVALNMGPTYKVNRPVAEGPDRNRPGRGAVQELAASRALGGASWGSGSSQWVTWGCVLWGCCGLWAMGGMKAWRRGWKVGLICTSSRTAGQIWVGRARRVGGARRPEARRGRHGRARRAGMGVGRLVAVRDSSRSGTGPPRGRRASLDVSTRAASGYRGRAGTAAVLIAVFFSSVLIHFQGTVGIGSDSVHSEVIREPPSMLVTVVGAADGAVRHLSLSAHLVVPALLRSLPPSWWDSTTAARAGSAPSPSAASVRGWAAPPQGHSSLPWRLASSPQPAGHCSPRGQRDSAIVVVQYAPPCARRYRWLASACTTAWSSGAGPSADADGPSRARPASAASPHRRGPAPRAASALPPTEVLAEGCPGVGPHERRGG